MSQKVEKKLKKKLKEEKQKVILQQLDLLVGGGICSSQLALFAIFFEKHLRCQPEEPQKGEVYVR